MNYRSEIEGLRALAVLPVVLFHFGVSRFNGGFIGVDVFFVISGYLISRILLDDLAHKRLSILAFYERRIRRIFPCLFAVILATGIGASLLLFPDQFDFFSATVTRVVLFCSNFFFSRHAGYFTINANTPLAHTWSLAVEEQFYIAFPLLLLALSRLPRAWLIITIAAIACTSFGWHIRATNLNPESTFFLPAPRAWELLTGTLVAIISPPPLSGYVRNSMALGGIAFILFPALFYTHETTLTPGWPVLPVLGTALVIMWAPSTVVARALSTRPIAYIGKISYSLYMWHWPVLVLGRHAQAGLLSTTDILVLLSLTFVISALSWRYIEQPFRSVTPGSRRKVFIGALCAISIGVAAGQLGENLQGWKNRFPREILSRLTRATNDFSPLRGQCYLDRDEFLIAKNACVYGSRFIPRVAVWGDSHAIELAYALAEIGAQQKASLVEITRAGCLPVAGPLHGQSSRCQAHNDKVLAWLLSKELIDTVILIGNFRNSNESERIIQGVQKTVNALNEKGKHVVLVQPYPIASWPVPLTVAMLEKQGRPERAFLDEASFKDMTAPYLDAFAKLEGPQVSVVSPSERLCAEGKCILTRDNVVLYYDSHHLTLSGARYVAPLIAEHIDWNHGSPVKEPFRAAPKTPLIPPKRPMVRQVQ